MADKNLDYEALTNEIAEKDTELTPKRMVEMRKELEGVELANRNDDHTFVWNELAERAQAEIDRLADAPIEDLSADQLDALGNLVQEFSSHIENKYTGTAAVLKDKITARANLLALNDDSPSLRLSLFYEKEHLFSQEGMGKLLTELCAKEDFTPTLEEINRLSDLKESNDLSGDAKDAVEAKMFSTLEKMNSDENFKFSYRDMSDLQDILRHENENMSEDLKNSLSKAVEDIELSEIEFLEDMRTTLLHGQTFDGLTVDETKSAIWNALGDQDRDLSQLRDAWEGWTPEQRAEIKQKFAEGDKEVVEMLDGLAKRVPTEEIPEIQMEAGKDYIIDIENLPELELGKKGYSYTLKLEDYKDMLSGLQPGDKIEIGRTPENKDKSIPIDMSHPNAKYVSGRHAYIEMGKDGQLHLVDNNSRNGTIVRGNIKEAEAEIPSEREIIDDKDAAFLDSITDENKQAIIDRYERLDNIAEELGDVFAKDEDGNYKVSGEGFNFQGLESFYDNVYIDADIPENPDEKPSEELRNKRDWLKDETQTLAINLALKDLAQDGSIDEIQDKEKLKQRFAEAVHDNMTFLTYSLVSTQAGFEAMSEGRNPDKMPPKDREAFLSAMRDKSANTAQVVSGILSGNDRTAVKLTTPGITATFAPYHQETESFAKGLKEKTGIGKLWNRVKAFDDKMTQKHPILWGFAKSSAISATLGPVGIAGMVGLSTYKQFKGLKKEYDKQKAENGGEMKLWDFVKKNPGKIASATVGVVATGIASYAGIDAALAGNFGIAGNVTGALLSGDAPHALSSVGSISFEHITEAGKNMVNSVADINHLNVQDVADGIKNSWTPTRTLRSAMNIGAGFAKAAEAYMKAEDGNKWSAAKKVFCGTVVGLVAGNALADVTTAAAHEYQEVQAYEHMKAEIEASEKAFQQELNNSDFSDIKIPLPPDYTIEGGKVPEVTVTGHAHSHAASEPTTKIHLEEVEGVSLNPVETEIKASNIEVKQVYNVNGEQVAVAQGETLEDTLDSARQEYLDNHPEIDDTQNKVKIEGNGVEATIKTEKEDIMSNDNEAVIGQETEIDRKIEVGNVEIKDHIEKTVTDTGKVEMQESTGRVDYNSNNNIPDGAKVTGAYHFENDNQKLDITSYEVDDKTYVTDGASTRELPEGQSIEKMYQTANAMLKETAEVSYQESQQQAEEKEQESPSPKPKSRILEGNSDITAEEIKMPEGHHTHNNNGSNGNESDEDSKNKANSGATASQEQEQSTAPVPEVKHNDMVIENGEEKPIYKTDIYKTLMNGGAEGKDTALNELIIETDGHGLMAQPRPNEDCLLKEIEINGEKMITIDAVAREDGSGKAAIIAYSNLEGTKAGLIFLEDGMNGKFSILEHKLGEEIHASDTLMEGKNAAESLKFSNLSQETTNGITGTENTIDSSVQDHTSQLADMGLKKATPLSVDTGANGQITTTETAYHPQISQGSNGFAVVQNGQVSTVTIENGKLHFQVSENGQTRDMTAKEASTFCQEVKTEGTKADGFNHKLFNKVEGMKQVNDARGISSYAPEPRGNTSGGNVNSQTMTKGGRGGM